MFSVIIKMSLSCSEHENVYTRVGIYRTKSQPKAVCGRAKESHWGIGQEILAV